MTQFGKSCVNGSCVTKFRIRREPFDVCLVIMKRQFVYGLLLLSFLLSGCFRDTITKFEDCFPKVTLISTESTPAIETIRASSRWDNFRLARDDYYVCVNPFEECGTFSNVNVNFNLQPVGTEIKLDGFAAKYNKVAVGMTLFFRGDINGRTVWLPHFYAKYLVDPANETSFKSIGMLDEEDKIVSAISWQCPNKN